MWVRSYVTLRNAEDQGEESEKGRAHATLREGQSRTYNAHGVARGSSNHRLIRISAFVSMMTHKAPYVCFRGRKLDTPAKTHNTTAITQPLVNLAHRYFTDRSHVQTVYTLFAVNFIRQKNAHGAENILERLGGTLVVLTLILISLT